MGHILTTKPLGQTQAKVSSPKLTSLGQRLIELNNLARECTKTASLPNNRKKNCAKKIWFTEISTNKKTKATLRGAFQTSQKVYKKNMKVYFKSQQIFGMNKMALTKQA
jgi:hypothetical protein